MKNIVVAIAMLAVLGIIVAVALNTGSQDAPPPTVTASTQTPLLESTDPYHGSPIPLAERIARDSGVPEAIEVATWYTQNAAPAFINPQPDGSLNLITPKEYEGKILPVLLVGEKEAHEADDLLTWYSSGGSEGQFTQMNSKSLILLRDRPRNEFDLGILQIHEAYHAKRTLVDNARASYSSNESMAAYEHVAVFELEHKIRSAIGGQTYRKYVDAEKQRLLDEGAQMGVNPDDTMKLHLASPISRKAELEAIFGPCGTDQDAIKRDLALWRQAVYELMDKNFPANRLVMAKASFYTIELGKN